MVRKSTGPFKGKNNLKFKSKNGNFKSKQPRGRFHNKEKRSNHSKHNVSQAKEKNDFKKYNRLKPSQSKTNMSFISKEDLLSSDSEPDAFSQLVSCFTNASTKVSAVSDEDSESELESTDDDQTMAEDDLSVEENSNSAESESDTEIGAELDEPSSKISKNDEVGTVVGYRI